MNLNCPKCSSENTQSLSIIYEAGLSKINTTTVGGGGVFSGGGGGGLAQTKGHSQSESSKRAAPPAKKPAFLAVGAVIVGFIFTFVLNGHGIFGSLMIVGGGISFYFATKYNKEKWPPLKATWDQSFLCNRCNNIFEAK